MKSRLPALALLLVALLLAACGSDDSSSSDKAAATATSSADACTKASLKTQTPGTLTVATDKPAYPPYFQDDKPSNGKGFESAVAYAIADKLGYDKSDVKWTVVPFNASYAPGPKQFDFDVNQISISAKREKAVDFSAPYFTAFATRFSTALRRRDWSHSPITFAAPAWTWIGGRSAWVNSAATSWAIHARSVVVRSSGAGLSMGRRMASRAVSSRRVSRSTLVMNARISGATVSAVRVSPRSARRRRI